MMYDNNILVCVHRKKLFARKRADDRAYPNVGPPNDSGRNGDAMPSEPPTVDIPLTYELPTVYHNNVNAYETLNNTYYNVQL